MSQAPPSRASSDSRAIGGEGGVARDRSPSKFRMLRGQPDAGGSADAVLRSEQSHIERQVPGIGGLTSILDRDGDGQIADDIANLAAGRLGGLSGGLGGILGDRRYAVSRRPAALGPSSRDAMRIPRLASSSM